MLQTRGPCPGPVDAGSRTLCLLALAALLAGCATAVPRRPPGARAGNQGAAWEAVLHSPRVAAALAGQDPAVYPEFARRDDALSARAYDPANAVAPWPPRDRPSLDGARRLFIRSRPDELIYFRSGTDRPHHFYYDW